MANFSALKTAIQNAIKQNGNEEITGNVLQQILLSIVNTMGDGAINTIEQNLSSETLARQGADNTLQQNIDSEVGARQSADNTLQSHIDEEALTRENADTQLQNVINAIKSDIDNGYVYAGIATPSSTPVSGKVFYIATVAGTYTNFGGQVLTQGINILRYNGSAWSSQQLIGIDDAPTAGSNSLVKSGGVQNELALGAVYDVSAKNPTGGPNNDGKWESLSALLSDANLNTLIRTTYRKGGMSIKFVHTSDNKYVQYRLMSQTFSTNEADWQGVDDVVRDNDNLVTGKGIKSNTLEEKEHPITDNDVAGYLTDKNKSIIAKLMKNGAVEWLVENSKDIANNARFEDIEDFLSYVSSEVPDSGNGVIKYLTDKDGKIIATINNLAETQFYGGGGFDGEMTKSRNVNIDAVKVLTDSKNNIIEWITSKGAVHIEELEVNKLKVKDNTDVGLPEFMWPLLGLVASGLKNRDVVNDKTYNLLEVFSKSYVKEGKTVPSIPCITLYDDDAIDIQLPTSYNNTATPSTSPAASNSKRGGYASKLFPLIHAFNMKYKDEILGKVTCFEAAEGQRIGLTKLHSYGDEFTGELNNNGKVLNKLIELGEWETVCHSMTARYMAENYLVNGLDSEFANEVLANGVWDGDLVHSTTVCYDTVTKKNYQIKPDKSGWTEIPNHYAKPYCAVSRASNSQLVINPTYSVKYQVGEWFKRADIAGLSYSMKDVGKRVYANWGSSHSIWHIRQNLKYADFGFGGTADTNTIPVDTVVHRFSWEPKVSRTPEASERGYAGYSGGFNLYTVGEYQRLVDMIDTCVAENGWSFLGNHNNTEPCDNYYLSNLLDFTYGELSHVNLYERELPAKPSGTPTNLYYYDPDYPEEWIIPLKYEELQDIIGENTHDYLNTPPSRLGISTWDEWYPCPGTGMALLWDALRYAVSKGVRFITAKEGFERFGNLLTIGYKFTNGEIFAQDVRLGNIPEESNKHCIIGADGSIFYND